MTWGRLNKLMKWALPEKHNGEKANKDSKWLFKGSICTKRLFFESHSKLLKY